MMLGVGDKFPKFKLEACTKDGGLNFPVITDETNKGKWQVVFFWPKDFTFVCPTEIVAFDNLNSEFEKRGAVLMGASIDTEFVHHAWKESNSQLKELQMPMLADVKRELSTELGILDKDAGVSQRATYIIDPEGTIKFVMVTDLGIGRNPEEVLRVLDALQTGGFTPCGWKSGDDTLKV